MPYQLGDRVFINSGGTVFVGSVVEVPSEGQSFYWILFDKKKNNDVPIQDYPKSYTLEDIQETMQWTYSEHPEHLIGTEFEVNSPTRIEIAADSSGDLCDRESIYYGRSAIDIQIKSTAKFDHVLIRHLGFHSHRKGKRDISLRDDGYHTGAFLMPNCSAYLTIAPFALTLDNIGDGFLKVSVRLPAGMKHCKILVLQEDKTPREVEDFVKVGTVWYATATINGTQRIIIENA